MFEQTPRTELVRGVSVGPGPPAHSGRFHPLEVPRDVAQVYRLKNSRTSATSSHQCGGSGPIQYRLLSPNGSHTMNFWPPTSNSQNSSSRHQDKNFGVRSRRASGNELTIRHKRWRPTLAISKAKSRPSLSLRSWVIIKRLPVQSRSTVADGQAPTAIITSNFHRSIQNSTGHGRWLQRTAGQHHLLPLIPR